MPSAAPARRGTRSCRRCWARPLLLAALAAPVISAQPLPPQQVARMNVLLPENSRVLSLAVSPDGRAIAVVLVKDGKQQIWIRNLDALEPTRPGGNRWRRGSVLVPGQPVHRFLRRRQAEEDRSLGRARANPLRCARRRGRHWNRNGEILSGADRNSKVSDAGGAVRGTSRAWRLDRVSGFSARWAPLSGDLAHYSGRQASWLNSMDGPESAASCRTRRMPTCRAAAREPDGARYCSPALAR